MAISMALGLLFMGGGARTLCTTNEAIAALVISLFPRFPVSCSDNRYATRVIFTFGHIMGVHAFSLIGRVCDFFTRLAHILAIS